MSRRAKAVTQNETTVEAIVREMAVELDIPVVKTREIVKKFVNKIIEHVENGDKLSIKGLVTFKQVIKAEIETTSPISQKKYIVPAHIRLKVSAAEKLKDAVRAKANV